MHAKSGLRVFLKWKVYRPDSVIAAVIRLGAFMSKREDFLQFVQTGVLAYCSTPGYKTTSTMRRANDAIDVMANAAEKADLLPDDISAAECAKQFIYWYFTPTLRDKSPEWLNS